MESKIKEIISKVSNSYGDDFIENISHAFIDIIEADYVFISEVSIDLKTSKTISLVSPGNLEKNIEYELSGSPCNNILDNSVCCYPKDVCNSFPSDKLLVDMDISGYIGSSLHNSKGEVSGIIVALYKNEIENESLAITLFQLFSGRISAEIERKDYENKLIVLNEDLEGQIKKSANDLQLALENLENAKNQIVESEKMAALGRFVAGISHEVNTPLGIAITTHSIIAEDLNTLNEKIINNKLKKYQLIEFCLKTQEAMKLQGNNLFRSKELIDDFKRTVVDANTSVLETMDLQEFYERTSNVMHGYLGAKNVIISLDFDSIKPIKSYPCLHNQVITNLVNNSVSHAFEENAEDKKISFSMKHLNDNFIQIDYFDNGTGINKEDRVKVFEPFYTTARSKGGSGLGLSIIYNIVTHKLGGKIKLMSPKKGFHLRYTVKDDRQIIN
jgi:two-component system NtrC family sensor kinase